MKLTDTTVPVTFTVTLSTPRRGLQVRRAVLRETATVDVPIPVTVTPDGVTKDGRHAVLRVGMDVDLFAADLQDRVSRAVAEFARGTDA